MERIVKPVRIGPDQYVGSHRNGFKFVRCCGAGTGSEYGRVPCLCRQRNFTALSFRFYDQGAMVVGQLLFGV